MEARCDIDIDIDLGRAVLVEGVWGVQTPDPIAPRRRGWTPSRRRHGRGVQNASTVGEAVAAIKKAIQEAISDLAVIRI